MRVRRETRCEVVGKDRRKEKWGAGRQGPSVLARTSAGLLVKCLLGQAEGKSQQLPAGWQRLNI